MATKRKPARRRRRPPIPPEKRGRRGHPAVDEQPGLRDWLIERLQLTPRPTLDDLMEELKGTGFSIGRTAVWAFRVKWEKILAERDLALKQAQEYAAIGGDLPLSIEQAIATMGGIAILQDLQRRLETQSGIVDEEIRELLNLASRMQQSAAQRERTKNGIERGVSRAMERIKGQMLDILRCNPQALKFVLAALEEAKRKELPE